MSHCPKTSLGPATRVHRFQPQSKSPSSCAGTDTDTDTGSPADPRQWPSGSHDGATAVEPEVARRNGRKGNKKTRTGCITCKIRRVKCDETKPSCLRCTKTGRNCDGYAPVAPRHRARDQTTPGHRAITPADPAPQPRYALSAKADWSSSEQRAFHFYQACSSSRLFSPVSSAFWTKVIPALCYQEPTIRHAVFAIGNLHETCFLGLQVSDQPLSSFAAAQYGKALRRLQTWSMPKHEGTAATLETLLPLLTCALFICIEFMIGNASAAHIHIIQGRRLLVHYDGHDGRSPAAELVRREIVPIYTRLSITSFLLGALPEPVPLALRWTAPGTARLEGFKTLADAAQAIHELLDDSYHFVQETRSWSLGGEGEEDIFSPDRVHFRTRGKELLDRLDMWEDAFAELECRPDDPTSIVARLYYHASRIFVGPYMERSRECSYDGYATSFASIVMLAGRQLDLEDLEAAARPGSKFSFEPGILPPVYSTVIKCRHPIIRRAALGLLRRRAASRHTENLWDTNQVLQIAEQATAVEEGAPVQSDDWVGGGDLGHDSLTSLPELGEMPVDWLAPNLFDDGSGLGPPYPDFAPAPESDLGPGWECYCESDTAPSRQATRDTSPLYSHMWRRSPEELLADMVRQSAGGVLDPGAEWVLRNPVPPEKYIPEERRIQIVATRSQDGNKSIRTDFMQPETGLILHWGVLYRETFAGTGNP